MLFDCFMFFNELELLEIRLHELRKVVDWFVLVEGEETFTGKPRGCVFEEHRQRFRGFSICHVRLPGFPAGLGSAWDREAYSRDAIALGLRELTPRPDDVVLLSDVDEIPRAEAVRQSALRLAQNRARTCYMLEQPMFYYYVNCKSDADWCMARVARYGDVAGFQALRTTPGVRVPNAGWHFSFLGGTERIREKILAYSHTEYSGPEYVDPGRLSRCAADAKDLFDRDIRFRIVPLDDTFPRYLVENQERFSHLIAAERTR